MFFFVLHSTRLTEKNILLHSDKLPPALQQIYLLNIFIFDSNSLFFFFFDFVVSFSQTV